MQGKRLFTAPRTQNAEDFPRTPAKQHVGQEGAEDIALMKRTDNFNHRNTRICTEVKDLRPPSSTSGKQEARGNSC